jgi:tape measure domain-containing protein
VASYDAKINVLLSGLRDLVLLEDRLEKIGSIVNTLNKTPIALNVGGRGKERDLSGQLSKEVNDYVREWVNGNKQIGKSINAVEQQVAAFNQLLRETAMVQQDPAAKAAVENLAAAWADTTRAATQYDKKLNDIQRKALGLQPQAVRDLEVARREAFVASGGKKARRERASFLAGAPVSQFPVGPAQASTRRRFEGDTSVERAESALVAKERRAQRALNIQFFAEEKAQVLELDRLRTASAQKQTQQIRAIGKAVSGSLSSAAIGGAFPLLFGQSPQAAVGGALGGLLGGAGGGFAGSLIGTALGELEAAKARTKELALELGFTSTQAKTLATAFELAGRNSQQLEAAVTNIQGLGLSTQETASAVKIAVELSQEYGGSVEKIAQAFADTLESGKVSIATLNKFTAQGIPIQDELAKKFGVSRTKLLEMAKDGQISVQQVTDVLVDMGIEAEKTASKGETGFDKFTKAVNDIATAVAGAAGALLKVLIPALDAVLTKLSDIINRATVAINLITDAQVGEASAALFRSGTARGFLGGVFTNKGNIDDLTQGLKSLQPLSAKTKEQFDRIAAVAQRYRTELQQYGGTLGEYAVGTAQVEFNRVQADLEKARKTVGVSVPPAAITGINAPANLPPSGDGSSKPKKDTAAEEKQRLDALLKQLQEEIRIRTETIGLEESLVEARSDQNDELEAQIQSSIRLLDIGSKQAVVQKNFEAGKIGRAEYTLRLQLLELDRTEDQIKYEEDLNRIFKERYGITDAIARLAREARTAAFGGTGATGTFRTDLNLMPGLTGGALGEEYDEVKLQLEELLKVENQVASAADTIGQAFGNSFKGILDGTLSAQEALAGFFSSVADSFADMVSQMIAQWIRMQIIGLAQSLLPGGSTVFPQGVGNFSGAFGPASSVSFNPGVSFGGFRAAGGSVTGGTSYMVGERGPELFVPGRSGTIVPNDKMGGGSTNVVVNVDAKGSSVAGDEQGANQLGRVISAAVQSELIKQQRPGGLLAR